MKGREGERKGEKRWGTRETSISCLLHIPNKGPGPKSRHVPWLAIEPVTFCSVGGHPTSWVTPLMESLGVSLLHCRVEREQSLSHAWVQISVFQSWTVWPWESFSTSLILISSFLRTAMSCWSYRVGRAQKWAYSAHVAQLLDKNWDWDSEFIKHTRTPTHCNFWLIEPKHLYLSPLLS